jgi:hypothetical protein
MASGAAQLEMLEFPWRAQKYVQKNEGLVDPIEVEALARRKLRL